MTNGESTGKFGYRQLPFRKKALFTIVLILVALSPLFILEIYVRATYPYADLWVKTGRKAGLSPKAEWAFIDAFSAYRGRPGIYGKTGADSSKTVNSHGFISTPEIPLHKPADTVRLVFLGGSSTAGTGVNLADEDTWPWQVAETIQARFPARKIDFINGALGGYTSFESYGKLWSRIRFFSPDIIVICHAWNEMYYFTRVDKIALWQTLPDGDWSFDRTTFAAYQPWLIDYLIRPSQALTRLRLRISKSRQGEAGLPKTLANDYDRRGVEIWRTNLRLFRETAKIIGAELFVANQATLIVPNLPLEEQGRARYDFHGFDHNAHVDAFAQIYQATGDEIRPDRIIDLSLVSGRSEFFYDHVHPTEAGAAKIAELVSNALIRYLQLDQG